LWLALAMGMVAVFHLGGGAARREFHALSTTLHGVGTIATGAAIALVGQIFNMQEHWPAAVLLWAVAAGAGWLLLRDEAQETLTLLLAPAWILCEFSFAAQGHIGANVYLGRILLAWAVLYLTIFIGSKHRIAQGILFAAAALEALVGIAMMLEGWHAWSASQTFLPFHLRVWGWIDIAALPLMFSVFRWRRSQLPVAVALALSIALPWCVSLHTQIIDYGGVPNTFTYAVPNLLAHALVAAFAIFIVWWGFSRTSRALACLGIVWFAVAVGWFYSSAIFGDLSRSLISQVLEAATALFVIWWGVRLVSKVQVNIGILGFAFVVGWFYFSDIMDKMGRSLGLIVLGVLFLAGGWALEKARRRLMARMDSAALAPKEAQ
jgi:cbb3-type cytochrome oxidase subunit 3